MKSTRPWTDEVFTLCMMSTVPTILQSMHYAVIIPRLNDCEFLNAHNLLKN